MIHCDRNDNNNDDPTSIAAAVKRKPMFIKVDKLKLGTSDHTLTVKVVSSRMVLQKGCSAFQHLRQIWIADRLVGDETCAFTFTARNEQVEDQVQVEAQLYECPREDAKWNQRCTMHL